MSDSSKAQEVAAQVRKVFKSDEIVTFLTSAALDVDVIETGIPSLDLALGVGGVPRGRVVEIFGPEGGGKTSTCLSICAQAQAAGGVAAFIDVEHALDPTWARKLDVDLDNLILSQPNSGEEALSLLQVLSGSGEVDVIIVDSVAAISPMAESTDDVTNIASGGMGLQARLMSSSLRKLCATIGQSPACVIFTNQVREKIGVMYGCFHGDSRVMLADGSSLPIRTIVNNQMPVDVLCWDHSENKVVSAPVIDWHRNGTAEQFIKFTVNDYTGAGRRRFLCTDHHIIPTPLGERRAEDLEVGDDVFFLNEKVLSDEMRPMLIGSILGDGSLLSSPNEFTGTYREDHCLAQTDYLAWKHSMLNNIMTGPLVVSDDRVTLTSKSLLELGELRELLYTKKRKTFSKQAAKELDWLGIACWYLDDGTYYYRRSGGGHACELCLEAFDDESIDLIIRFFTERLGGEPLYLPMIRSIRFRAQERDKLHANISPYVVPCMQYKLGDSHRDKFVSADPWECNTRREMMSMKLLGKEIVTGKRSMQRFDITVQNHANYFVSNVNVHNSPETTPGGRALKFYSSVRIRTSSSSSASKLIGAKDNPTGQMITFKIVKNKVAPPFKTAEAIISFERGWDKEEGLVTTLITLGIAKRAGAYYDLIGERFQGRSAIVDYMREDPLFCEEARSLLLAQGKAPMVGEVVDESEDTREEEE